MKEIYNIPVNISVEELARSVSRDEAFALIKAIDLRVAEVDFTLDVLRELIKSLESDLTKWEIAKELGFAKWKNNQENKELPN